MTCEGVFLKTLFVEENPIDVGIRTSTRRRVHRNSVRLVALNARISRVIELSKQRPRNRDCGAGLYFPALR
jgi:hypothetical protein